MTPVYTPGIGIPQIPPHPCDRLAGDVVDELALANNRDTRFVLSHVFADEFAADVVRAVITVRVQENVFGPRENGIVVIRRDK